jgi:hypothetical protein
MYKRKKKTTTVDWLESSIEKKNSNTHVYNNYHLSENTLMYTTIMLKTCLILYWDSLVSK